MPDDSQMFEVQGKWWLPSHKDHEVSGTLYFSLETGAELRLIGALFSANGSYATSDDGIYKRIHGFADGKEFTLEDCFQKSFNMSAFLGSETEVIRVQQIYKGVWYTEEDEPNADRTTVDIRYLTQWIGRPGITGSHSFSHAEPGAVIASLEARSQSDLTLELEDDISVKFQHRISWSRSRGLEQILRERYVCTFEHPSLLPTTAAMEYVSDLQDLISIATGRSAEYDAVTFSHPQVTNSTEGAGDRLPINFFTQWTVRDRDKKPGDIHPTQMYFTFDDLDGVSGVKKWLTCAHRHRSTLGRVMASRYHPSLFVSDRLFHRAAAIEAFGRKRIGYKGVKLPGALEHCYKLAGDLFGDLVGGTEEWAKVVKSNRDDIGHHYDRRPDQGGSAQYFLAESLYWLFVLCLLRESEAPDAVFERIKKSSEWAWLSPKVKAVVQAG